MAHKYTNMLMRIAMNHVLQGLDNFAKDFNMTGMQMSFIDFISRQGDHEVLQRDLENEFDIQRSTATVLLQRMEKRGLLYRQSSTSDGRQKSVFLTEKSRNLETQINSYMKQRQDALENNFSTEEIASFEKILKFYINEEDR